ncbi:Cell cycle response regulator CtrA (plasmid) [Caballeronia sp. SBC1]|nr:Cell cycle response regulator CtrA [Caballeronia sp. SBC2]QIN67785.1 Cell cycle response regulator CtrA [Caballeronia sp. SBC1]
MPSNRSDRTHLWTNRRVQAGAAQLRVLVVDDNSNAAHALAAYLSLEDIDCRIAFGGAEAIDVGTDWAPHVIIMDISMPDCNGVQAAIALRNSPCSSDIIIVAFTALDEDEVRRHLIGHEFDAYYQKGQSPSLLLALVMAFVG